MPQFTQEPTYNRWLSKRMWTDGMQLFTEDVLLEEVQRVAFLIAQTKETLIKKAKFKGNEVFLLYQTKTDFPFVPTMYYYSHIDPEESGYLRLSDLYDHIRDRNGNIVGSYEVQG